MGKRKLDEHDVPQEASAADPQSSITSFENLGLEARLLQAIAKEKYSAPTPVQVKAIPLALEGRDILARAKTGSGKTAAYVLPILQSLLKRKSQATKTRGITALILVPTRELASQVTKAIATFASFCVKDVRAVDLTPQISDQAQKALLASSPDIVVATPSRASTHLNTSTLIVEDLAHLVIDEADLVLSYEYGDDFDNIVKLIPQGVQTFLASATLSTDVDTLKGLFCRDPVILNLQDAEKESKSVSQYSIRCAEDEKFLLIFALFKLKLIKGKCIVFVADVDRCYRVKLYLEQFGIKSCILNSELPVNSRIHVVEEFNKGVYDIIIATDEHQLIDEKSASSSKQSETNGHEAEDPDTTAQPTEDALATATKPAKKRKQHHTKRDANYGISRGIDFHAVTCVLNFDLPATPKSYTHRIGRTARAGRTGIALSFCIPSTSYRKHKTLTHPANADDEPTLAKISAAEAKKGNKIEPYAFDMKKLEGFRYRVSSALKAVSAGAVREARLRELRQEMLKSERLKRHLQENPEDERWLRHDEMLRPKSVQSHLRHVPDYLMPGGVGAEGGAGKSVEVLGAAGLGVGLHKVDENRIRKARERNKMRGKGKRGAGSGGRKSDPLKSFNAKGRGK